MHTVRIYADGALLSEHEFVSNVEAREFAREMAADAPEHRETVTLDGRPVDPRRMGPQMISPYRGRWAIP